MDYGDKLRKIHEIYEEAGANPGSKYSVEELHSIKKKISSMLAQLRENVCAAIDAGDVPQIKIEKLNDMSWLLAADEGNGLFAILWTQEMDWYQSQGLEIKLTPTHDVGGMREWLTVKVIPYEPAFSSGPKI